MADRITYVGLDVHKESIVVAVAEGGLQGEVREYGRFANTATALERLLRKLGGNGVTPRFCYQAGPCGDGIQRRLSAQGHECVAVAPSLIPKRAGWCRQPKARDKLPNISADQEVQKSGAKRSASRITPRESAQ
jgi:transposase